MFAPMTQRVIVLPVHSIIGDQLVMLCQLVPQTHDQLRVLCDMGVQVSQEIDNHAADNKTIPFQSAIKTKNKQTYKMHIS